MTNGAPQQVILVVDDEASVRRICRVVLEKAGHCVLEASDGAKALQLLATYKGPIDLVVCDVVMPQMSGIEFAAHLKNRHPGLNILLISGHVKESPVQGVELLRKPFRAQALATSVDALLARRPVYVAPT